MKQRERKKSLMGHTSAAPEQHGTSLDNQLGQGKTPTPGPPLGACHRRLAGPGPPCSCWHLMLSISYPTGPHPAQLQFKKPSKPTKQPDKQQIAAFSSTLSHQTISSINLIKMPKFPFNSGEFPPLFPQKSLWMYCQERAFAVAFQVAWNNKELSLQLRSDCTI